MHPLIITLDGPAGSGKSTVAQRLAKRLGLQFLDTGAMYRGLTAFCLDSQVNPVTEAQSVIAIAQQAPMEFDWLTDPPRLHLDGYDLTDRLRDPDVTLAVNNVAAIPQVRVIMVQAQRRIAQEHPRLVTEGRDQGSVVFPNAQAKFYLDASAHVRAARRTQQLRDAGKPADEANVFLMITKRDHSDIHRQDGPLICPQDAQQIDTSDLTLDQVVDLLDDIVRQRITLDLDTPPTPPPSNPAQPDTHLPGETP